MAEGSGGNDRNTWRSRCRLPYVEAHNGLAGMTQNAAPSADVTPHAEQIIAPPRPTDFSPLAGEADSAADSTNDPASKLSEGASRGKRLFSRESVVNYI